MRLIIDKRLNVKQKEIIRRIAVLNNFAINGESNDFSLTISPEIDAHGTSIISFDAFVKTYSDDSEFVNEFSEGGL